MVKTEQFGPVMRFAAFEPVYRSEDTADPWIVVRGLAFVNEDVGSGPVLARSAMEAATADYLRFGAVREMHQPSAVGTCVGQVTRADGGETIPLGVVWTERGAEITAKVVDPDAIRKVDEGVYRGFSVGVQPLVMRGNAVTKCRWIENSLVDVPKDGDAVIEAFRSAGLADATDTVVFERGIFADIIAEKEEAGRYWRAINTFEEAVSTIKDGLSGDAQREALNVCASEFADYLMGQSTERTVSAEITRAQEAESEARESVAALETRVTELQSELEAAKASAEKPNPVMRAAPPLYPSESPDDAAAKREKRIAELNTALQRSDLPQSARDAMALELSRLTR